MKWKDTWIHEALIPAYQTLVNMFWEEQSQLKKDDQVQDEQNNEVLHFYFRLSHKILEFEF